MLSPVRSAASQSALLAPVAAGLWSVGVIIYLMVITLILLRWLTVPMTPARYLAPTSTEIAVAPIRIQ